ncbi:MAG: type VII toxin-antitoxin system MntA family adenylyltransferase antitoxin [Promethearchaeota archaeon]
MYSDFSSELLFKLKKKAESYNITFLAIFGSYARNEQKKESDVDILVSFMETPSLLTLIQIENDFSQICNKKVDLVTIDSLNPFIKNQVLKEMKVIYN